MQNPTHEFGLIHIRHDGSIKLWNTRGRARAWPLGTWAGPLVMLSEPFVARKQREEHPDGKAKDEKVFWILPSRWKSFKALTHHRAQAWGRFWEVPKKSVKGHHGSKVVKLVGQIWWAKFKAWVAISVVASIKGQLEEGQVSQIENGFEGN